MHKQSYFRLLSFLAIILHIHVIQSSDSDTEMEHNFGAPDVEMTCDYKKPVTIPEEYQHFRPPYSLNDKTWTVDEIEENLPSGRVISYTRFKAETGEVLQIFDSKFTGYRALIHYPSIPLPIHILGKTRGSLRALLPDESTVTIRTKAMRPIRGRTLGVGTYVMETSPTCILNHYFTRGTVDERGFVYGHGSTETINPDGSRTIIFAEGSHAKDGFTLGAGTTAEFSKDGSMIFTFAEGTKDAKGKLFPYYRQITKHGITQLFKNNTNKSKK